jgi:hypothetical protein
MGELKVINVEVSDEAYKIAKIRSVHLDISLKEYIDTLILCDGEEGKVTSKKVRK